MRVQGYRVRGFRAQLDCLGFRVRIIFILETGSNCEPLWRDKICPHSQEVSACWVKEVSKKVERHWFRLGHGVTDEGKRGVVLLERVGVLPALTVLAIVCAAEFAPAFVLTLDALSVPRKLF